MHLKIAILVCVVVLAILSEGESKKDKSRINRGLEKKDDGSNGRIKKVTRSGENGSESSDRSSKTKKSSRKLKNGKRQKGKPGRKRQLRNKSRAGTKTEKEKRKSRRGKSRRLGNKFRAKEKKGKGRKDKCKASYDLSTNPAQTIADEYNDKKKKKCNYKVKVNTAAIITIKCDTFNFPENCKLGSMKIKEGRKGKPMRTKKGKNTKGTNKYCGSGSWEYSTSSAVTSLKIKTKGKQYAYACTISKGSGSVNGTGSTSTTTSQPGVITQPGVTTATTAAGGTGYDWCKEQGSDSTMCKYPGVDTAKCKGLFSGKTISTADKQIILTTHNNYREKVSQGKESGLPAAKPPMPDLKWDDTLSEVAQRWADQCTWGHDTNRNTASFSYVGQNMYQAWSTAKPTTVAWQSSIDSWYSEVKDYIAAKQDVNNFQSVSGPAIGHFTQVIWAATTHIGCGYVQYEGKEGFTTEIACNYGPGGNMIGSPIYVPATK